MVVIPDMLSKNASLKEKSKLANMNGIEPNIAIDNQAKVEKRKFVLNLADTLFVYLPKQTRSQSG